MTDTDRKLTAADFVNDASIARTGRDWTAIAGEPVRMHYVKGLMYGFCSELGALRLEHKYNLPRTKGRAFLSADQGWAFCLEIA